jgi:hypothetical protein
MMPKVSTDGSHVADAPRVLVITAHRWLKTTRLAFELFEAGFKVEALCPANHSLERVSFVSMTYRYSALSPIRSLRDAIEASRTDLLIPGDDHSAAQLHKLYFMTKGPGAAADNLRSLIARSLGNPEHYPILHARNQIATQASALGVIFPTSEMIRNGEDLVVKLDRIGFPCVLKTDGSYGGTGVAIVHNKADAIRAFRKLDSRPSLLRMLKRLIIDHDANLVLPCLLRRRSPISIQRFVHGRPANAAIACWKGEVLAQVNVEVVATAYANGPATVVKVIEHPGMLHAVELLTRWLQLSGLCGFDFILNPSDAKAHMIELNPRATPTCHLVSSDGTQPLASLAARFRGLPDARSEQVPVRDPIALFPCDIDCDPKTPFSQSLHNDVPWQSPELIDLGFKLRAKQSFLAKIIRLCGMPF